MSTPLHISLTTIDWRVKYAVSIDELQEEVYLVT